MFVEIKEGKFELVNESKVDRALNGTPLADGTRKGGIVNEDGSYDPYQLISEYDKMLGLIKKGSDKVCHGCFYNFKFKKARAVPEISFLYRVNGKEVIVPDGVELPGIVKASKILAEDAPKKKSRKAKEE